MPSVNNDETPLGTGSGNREAAIQVDESVFLVSTQEANALEKLYDYFIKETMGDPIPFGRWEKLGIFLEILGSSGGIYALPPAWQYAKNKPFFVKYSLVSTNPISNVLFLANATDGLLDSIAMERQAPQELANIIELPTKKELGIKYTKMFAGSVVCAVPFGVATYLFPLPHCSSVVCLSATVTHSLAANTVLHAISWSFILTPTFWYYRLPLLPFEKAYEYYQACRLAPEQKQLLTIKQTQGKIYQKYKDILCQFFSFATYKIVDDYIKNQKNQREIIPLRSIKEESASILTLAQWTVENRLALPEAQSRSCVGRFFNATHRLLANGGMGLLGGTFMVVGCIGWVASPIYIGIQEGLTIPESAAVGGLPAYSTGVLCAFYGAAILNQIYQYLTSWKGGISDKFSAEARMYPKTFALFLLINTYIAIFAYGTAQQLIITIFGNKMWNAYRPYLQDTSIPALQILSFVPLLGLFSTFVRKSIAKFGADNDHTMAERLLVKSMVINQRLQQMKGDKLMTSIQQYSAEQQTYLGISPAEFEEDVRSLSELEQQKQSIETAVLAKKDSKSVTCCNNFFSFWRNRDESKKPLLVSDKVKEKNTSKVHKYA